MTRDDVAGPGARVTARSWGWRHAGRSRWAVRELDLDIEPGERVLLLGASGAGKSTLLHALAGVLGGDDEGESVGTLTVDGKAPSATRGRSGLVLQDPDAQTVMARVGDDVAFGCENLGVPREQIWPRVRAALEAVGLDLPLDTPTSALSGGQKQRLALAGALAMRPGLLLLDEPTANLDPIGVAEVRDAVAALAQESSATVVIVEHRVQVWAGVVDRVIVLDSRGGILAQGEPEKVLRSEAAALEAAGIWLPGTTFDRTRAPAVQGNPLLLGRSLGVGRTPFGMRTAQVAATGIDFTAARGSALAVTGPNGAGKSTFALTAAGLLPPVSGTLEATPALSRGSRGEPVRWRSRELVGRIGSVFQDPEHQFVRARVRDELAVGALVTGLGSRETERRVDELLQRLRLARLADANPFTLSGGEKRRLSVATALATRPDLLVLDEPTFGQDARTWRELAALLDELLTAGHAVIAVTHDDALVRVLADDVLELRGASSSARAGRRDGDAVLAERTGTSR
ncbi:ABC transporter ATP-binding protein [Humibacter ginsenosidimutans]|uniref:ATP-binding cassette domain-containing protein n=1 Tax=Humibacter ginsenosidimutans TaxID=2599293 RepID=A0A5B8LZV3_9MICO|nr:ATP-binding cassette domain-containing protein [Humibacter ginsenosidimutans]QDZ14048.1 ATP-binding cassette domain-containing protein [Humibacter ginsenosidimutans]